MEIKLSFFHEKIKDEDRRYVFKGYLFDIKNSIKNMKDNLNSLKF